MFGNIFKYINKLKMSHGTHDVVWWQGGKAQVISQFHILQRYRTSESNIFTIWIYRDQKDLKGWHQWNLICRLNFLGEHLV